MGDLFEPPSIDFVESGKFATIDIEHCNNLIITKDRHHYLAAALTATGNMAREFLYIGNNNGSAFFPGCATHPSPVGNMYTCYRPLKRSEDKFWVTLLRRHAPLSEL